MMRFVDVLLSIPQLFLLIVLAVIFHHVTHLVDHRDRIRRLARARPTHPGRDPDTAGPRVRPGRQGDGRQSEADRDAPRHPQHRRHHCRECHVPGGRRHPPHLVPGVPRPRAPRPPDRLGVDDEHRGERRRQRVLVEVLSGRVRASCWWWWRSTSWATRCATPSRSGSSVADAARRARGVQPTAVGTRSSGALPDGVWRGK